MVAEKQVFFLLVGGSRHGHKDTIILGLLFGSPASPPLFCRQPAALPSLLLLFYFSWAFDQSWPLCHSCPSGGSSPSPTTTLPAGLPSLMNTYGCKRTGANRGTHTQTSSLHWVHPHPPPPPPPEQKIYVYIINFSGKSKQDVIKYPAHMWVNYKDRAASTCERGAPVRLSCVCVGKSACWGSNTGSQIHTGSRVLLPSERDREC